MNKGKIVTSIGAVLLTTGIIGGIWSGVVAMPKIINNVQNVENNLNKEDILYKGQIDLTKLNINSKTSNVIIKKYDGQDIIDEYINDHYADAYDENLEYYVEKAMYIASDTFAELAEGAQEEADDLLEEIKKLGEVSKNVLILFKKLPLEKIKIDNTRK